MSSLASLTGPLWQNMHLLTRIGSTSFSKRTGSLRLMETTGIGAVLLVFLSARSQTAGKNKTMIINSFRISFHSQKSSSYIACGFTAKPQAAQRPRLSFHDIQTELHFMRRGHISILHGGGANDQIGVIAGGGVRGH